MRYSLLSLSYCLILLASPLQAVEKLPHHLINFTSPEGLVLLRSNLTPNVLKLLSHFTTQHTMTNCGIASAVMVLNAINLPPPIDPEHSAYRYFTQDNFFNDQIKKIISPKEVIKHGMNLTSLNKALQAYRLKTKLYFANHLNLKTFRKRLQQATNKQQFVILNFSRALLQQTGSGHYSPIAAYDQQTDRFLLLEVARYKYPAYWVKTKELWQSVHTKDGNQFRGFVIISRLT